jgi:periplasmic divalent cation tolerance protein
MTTLCFTTCSSKEEARKIADSLLEKKLVACANILPGVESHYWWKGKREQGEEVLLILKTGKELREKVEEEIKKLHSYEMPVIEFVEASVEKEVQEWVEEETQA